MGESFLFKHSQSSVTHKETRKSCWRLLCSVPSRLPLRLRLMPLPGMVVTTVTGWVTMGDIEATMVSPPIMAMPLPSKPVHPTQTDGPMDPTTESDPIFWANVKLRPNPRLKLRLLPIMEVTTVDSEDTEVTMVSLPIMAMPLPSKPVLSTQTDGLTDPTMDSDPMENRFFCQINKQYIP